MGWERSFAPPWTKVRNGPGVPCRSARMVTRGIVAEVVFETSFPLSPIALGDAFDLSLAEDVEAVHECDADVDFGGLAVGVS